MAWRQELAGQGQIVLMMDQKGDFLLWISLSAITPQKGDGDLCESDHRSLVREVFLA